jgi:hypothetical protein
MHLRERSVAMPPDRMGGLRSLTSRHWRLALGAGLALGVVYAATTQMWTLSPNLDNVWMGMVIALTLVMSLVPLGAIASGLRVPHIPRWLVFTAAGCVASGITYVVGFALFVPLVLGVKGGPSWQDVLWANLPPLLMTGILGALGYMHWIDAKARSRALHAAKIERLRYARETYEARLSALQARVEPSFLFETLSAVEALYEKDAALGAQVLDDLIVHLRAALPAAEEVSSSLAVEMQLARTWLDIMRLRSGNRLTFAIVHDEAPDDARMPPMVLLPLVQHAVAAAPPEACAVTVTAAAEGGSVCITVVGPPGAFSPSAGSAVLAQIRERVEALYGDSASLEFSTLAHARSQAILEVPYERSDRRPR